MKKPQDMLEFLRRNREQIARAPQATGPGRASRPRPAPSDAPPARKPRRREPAAAARRPEGAPPRAAPPRSPAAPATARPEYRIPGAGPLLTLPVRVAWGAGGGALVLLLLAFWLGSKLGAGGEIPDNEGLSTATGPGRTWAVRVATFDEDQPARAEATRDALLALRRQRGLPEAEMAIERLEEAGKLVVTIGSWSRDPTGDREAGELLAWVRRLQNRETGKPQFSDARFWMTPR